MSINYETMKTQISAITELFDDKNNKSIILDFSTFNDPSEIEHLKQYLRVRLLPQEEEYYAHNKEKLEDLSDFEQRFLEIFYNDLAIKDYCSAMIFNQTQVERPQILNSTQKLLEFFQYNQSTIKRACVFTEGNPKELATQLKAYGVGNRPSVTLLSIKLEYDIDNQTDESLLKLGKDVRAAQLASLAPIVDVKFKTNNIQQLYYNCRVAFSRINQAFIENDVETEYLMFCTNIVDLAIQYFGEGPLKGDYANKQYAQTVGYFVVKTLFNSIPPSYGAIFFTFHREFLQSKKIFHFLNNLKSFSAYIAWPFGVVLNARIFDQVVRSFSIVQRQQSATITINQVLKVFQDALAGQYKDEVESEVLKPIEIGAKSQ